MWFISLVTTWICAHCCCWCWYLHWFILMWSNSDCYHLLKLL